MRCRTRFRAAHGSVERSLTVSAFYSALVVASRIEFAVPAQ